MTIIVTGCAGFIGTSLCDYFIKNNIDFIGIDDLSYGYHQNVFLDQGLPKYTFYKKNICDKDIINIINKNDIIIHLAAISSLAENQVDPILSYQTNVIGTLNLLEASRKKGVKHFVFASTSAVYENSKSFPLKEENEISPPHLIYSLSKFQCEDLLKSFQKNYGLNYTIIRFFNTYGPKNDYHRKIPPLIPYIIKELSNDQIPILHSTGVQKRDYIYIDDLIDLIILVIDNTKSYNKTFNACFGKEYSVNEIYIIIKNILDKNIEPIFQQSDKYWDKYSDLFNGELKFDSFILDLEVNKYTKGNSDYAKNELNWNPKIDIEEGIKKVIDYFVNSKLN